MSCTGTKRNRNRGTASCTINPMCKKQTKHSTNEVISKYFTKPEKEEDSDSDSPYKNCLNEVKGLKLNNSASDLDDFKTPKPMNKISKIGQSRAVNKTTKKRKKKSYQPRLRKFVEDNFKHIDVNPDHLQMALTMSVSSYESENPHKSASSDSKMECFKKALEQYGFGYQKSKVSADHKRVQSDIKKNKKSRYRYITPTLKIRTTEERDALISSKISLILSHKRKLTTNVVQNSLFSETLKKYECLKICKFDQLELNELKKELFYVKRLALETNNDQCGILLKEWGRIPGRESTPKREVWDQNKSNEISSSSHENENSKKNPDLILIEDSEEQQNPELSSRNSDKTPSRSCESPETETAFFDDHQQALLETSSRPCNSFENRDLILIEDSEEQDPKLSCRNSSVHKTPSMSCESPETETVFFDDHQTLLEMSSGSCNSFKNPDLILIEDSEEEQDPELSCRNSSIHKIPSKSCESPETETAFFSDQALLEMSLRPRNSSQSFNSQIINLGSPENQQKNFPLSKEKELNQSGNKRPYQCISPDLFDSSFENCLTDDDAKEVEHYDLTQSDHEESFNEPSNLDVTNYVENLLNANKEKKLEKISTSDESSTYISDDELNYSSVFSKNNDEKEIEFNFSEDSPLSLMERIKSKSRINTEEKKIVGELVGDVQMNYNLPSSSHDFLRKHSNNTVSDQRPVLYNPLCLENISNETPSQSPRTPSDNNFFIKTTNVTPMANFEEMSTPTINRELDKYGLKPFNRQKGINLLKYIYESTHPILETENNKVVKKRRSLSHQFVEIVGDVGDEDNLIFEKTQSKQIASCRIPLHIVWHNFVMSNPKIRENILLYEPLQLEVLHSMLKEQGFKFNIQDLLSFLDTKCVTIRTSQGQNQVRKKSK